MALDRELEGEADPVWGVGCWFKNRATGMDFRTKEKEQIERDVEDPDREK